MIIPPFFERKKYLPQTAPSTPSYGTGPRKRWGGGGAGCPEGSGLGDPNRPRWRREGGACARGRTGEEAIPTGPGLLGLALCKHPRTCWGVFPKRCSRAPGWERPVHCWGPTCALKRHALSTVGWGTLLAFLGLLPAPPPWPLSLRLHSPQHVPLSSTCTCASCCFWLPHTLRLRVQPHPCLPWVLGLCMARADWGGVRAFWDRSPVGCSLELRVAKTQNLTSLPHMWGHLYHRLLIHGVRRKVMPSRGDESSHKGGRVCRCYRRGGRNAQTPTASSSPSFWQQRAAGVFSVQE